jgi:hypothetical protein
MTAKTHAITSLHRDNSLPKVPGLCPDAASVNAYLLYCRPLGGITSAFNIKQTTNEKSAILDNIFNNL